MDPKHFIDVMAHWREYFTRDAELPVIGATAEALRSISVPACVIPGNDWTHPRRVGENASRLPEGWDEKRGEMGSIFIDFLDRVSVASPV